MYQVLIASKSRLIREALAARLAEEPDMAVAGSVSADEDLLLLVRATEANLVIHAVENDESQALYGQLLAEYPGLAIVRLQLDANRAVLLEQRIVKTPLSAQGMDALLTAVRLESSLPVDLNV